VSRLDTFGDAFKGLLRLCLPAAALAAAVLVPILAGSTVSAATSPWTPDQMATIQSLSLAALPPLPPDPTNRVADNPAAARLGKALFSDKSLSGEGLIACDNCHFARRAFQNDIAFGQGMGETHRRTPPIAGTAYNKWFNWDGRRDSMWSQALGPLEDVKEHAGDRTALAKLVVSRYRNQYEAVFGPAPDLSAYPRLAKPFGSPNIVAEWNGLTDEQRTTVNTVFSNIGKAIAAFERRIEPGQTRFDRYAAALAAGEDTSGLFDAQQTEGLALFMGKANCISCHNGPMISGDDFHNTGVPIGWHREEDLGHQEAVPKLLADEFNCRGPYSDAGPADCSKLDELQDGPATLGAFKPPSLRGAAARSPFMHAGQFRTIDDVIDHYDAAQNGPVGVTELKPLGLTDEEKAALAAFLDTLQGLPVVNTADL